MEQAINNIRKELASHQAKSKHEQADRDARGISFNLGYQEGLKRALALLEEAEPIADEVSPAQRDGRQTGKRGGAMNAQYRHWPEYAIWIGDSAVGKGAPLFILRCPSGLQVYTILSALQPALAPDVALSVKEWRE